MTDTKLLIIHQGALGDVVLTFPAIIALRNKFDRVDILCQGQTGKLAVQLELIDEAYPLEAADFATLYSNQAAPGIKNLISQYARFLVFSFSPDLEKAINRITDRPCLRIPSRPPVRDRIHVTEFIFQNLKRGGLIERTDVNSVVSDWHKEQAHRIDRPPDRSKVVIHPGSGSVRKRWPLDRFIALAKVLENKGGRPHFVCGPAESDLIGEIQTHNQQVHHFSKLTDLARCLRTAGGYVGNDSGASHLAAFLGLPSVVIFGPADPMRWKPPGPRIKIVRPSLDCHPCFEIEPENCDEPECLADASLETVVEAFVYVYQGE
jgi:ADP-heptose:LPS heptosyltransferase